MRKSKNFVKNIWKQNNCPPRQKKHDTDEQMMM